MSGLIIYDAEIVNAIPPRSVADRLPDIDYCEGWRDFDNMGIACICTWDLERNHGQVYLDDNIGQFFDLSEKTFAGIGGFNTLAFDNPLMVANGGSPTIFHQNPALSLIHLDLLVQLWLSAGLSPVFDGPDHHGFGLDATARANGLSGKQKNHVNPAVLWQRGQHGDVINRCLHDVWLTATLATRWLGDGFLRDPRDPSRVLTMADAKTAMDRDRERHEACS